jgi:D-serine dehydratase
MPKRMNAQKYMESSPVIRKIAAKEETAWINPYLLPFAVTDATCQLVVSDGDIKDAEKRLARFASFIRKCFPETEETQGLIESPLTRIPSMQKKLEETYGCRIPGQLLLKMDSHLAIAGSVKARGGIYEVLKHAEDLALEAGKLRVDEDYAKLAEPEMQAFFGQYTVQVGSTGNLGLSIGIMSAALGFKVKVHMSADAKQWKKDLLRSKGVEVIEYADDYSRAVAEGRKNSDLDPMSYFVDDEKSVNLFLGYAVAAGRLKQQLDEKNIVVDEKHPLIVYIPAGVGGAPGGVAYGLKRIFKDNVHCFFTEPTMCPSVLLGVATQEFECANVHDFGISGKTEADGLACASPSGFVTRIMTNLLSGEFTVSDGKLYDYLRLLYNSEEIQIEPSSCAAFSGPCGLLQYEDSRKYCESHGLDKEKLENAVQIAWATGGRLVPEEIRKVYLETCL